jgi:hypothetical protein
VQLMDEAGDMWRAAWKHEMGPTAILRTNARWDTTVRHLGYEPVGVSWGVQSALGQVIRTDTQLVQESQDRLREAEIIPDGRLDPRQLGNLELARAMARSLYAEVRGLHAAMIPPASDRMRTAGMYGRRTQEIFIAVDQLDRARDTVDVVIHELAHHTSGAEDGEEAHNSAMTKVAAYVVERTAKGDYDVALENAYW